MLMVGDACRIFCLFIMFYLLADLCCFIYSFGTEIMNEVVRSKTKSDGKPGTEWRILIVDKLAMRMVSACTKMHEISAEGVTCKWRDIND